MLVGRVLGDHSNKEYAFTLGPPQQESGSTILLF